MSTQASRMQFLRGDFIGKEIPLRPPWVIAESLFTEICTNCGECLFCEQCVDVCKPRALLKSSQQAPWTIKALINEDNCFSYQGVACHSCYEPCEARAIQMPPRLGSISIPVLNSNNCTGCGTSFAVCPVHTITIYHLSPIQ